jgi:hypothetical protein
MASGEPLDLPFRIEQWDDTDSRVDELIALVADHRCGNGCIHGSVETTPWPDRYPASKGEGAG